MLMSVVPRVWVGAIGELHPLEADLRFIIHLLPQAAGVLHHWHDSHSAPVGVPVGHLRNARPRQNVLIFRTNSEREGRGGS